MQGWIPSHAIDASHRLQLGDVLGPELPEQDVDLELSGVVDSRRARRDGVREGSMQARSGADSP